MKYHFNLLERTVATILSGITESDPTKFLPTLEKLSYACHKSLIKDILQEANEKQKTSSFNLHMRQLIMMADQLYQHDPIQAQEYCAPLLQLIGKLKQSLPEILAPDLSLPKAFRAIQFNLFKSKLAEILLSWEAINLDPSFLDIVKLPIEEFGHSRRNFKWFHFSWSKKYLAALEELKLVNFDPKAGPEYLVMKVMIKMDFNHVRFVNYCSDFLKMRAEALVGMEEHLYMLNRAKKEIGQLHMLSNLPYYDDLRGLREELTHWLNEEITFKERFDVEQFEIEGKKVPLNRNKLVFKWKAEQLAFWEKLQLDHGIYEEPSLDVFCNKIACNFSTKHRENLSGGSIKSKLYLKEPELLEPLRNAAKRMYEDLNVFFD